MWPWKWGPARESWRRESWGSRGYTIFDPLQNLAAEMLVGDRTALGNGEVEGWLGLEGNFGRHAGFGQETVPILTGVPHNTQFRSVVTAKVVSTGETREGDSEAKAFKLNETF
jgi:hypothetical protein